MTNPGAAASAVTGASDARASPPRSPSSGVPSLACLLPFPTRVGTVGTRIMSDFWLIAAKS